MPDKRLIALGAAVLAASAVFLFWGGAWRSAYVLELRGIKLGGLICVGTAVGIATVLFQTLSNNRILTPSIMGFDALFILMKTLVVFASAGVAVRTMPTELVFLTDTLFMIGATLVIFLLVLRRARQDIQLLILVGVIFGLLFRTLAGFMQRLLDPSEFAMVQANMFAQFSGIDRQALFIAVCLMILVVFWLASKHLVLDVMALGRGPASTLGVSYDRLQVHMLIAIATLVAVSTALVGPLAFLGLLVTALTHSLMQSHRHALLLPGAALMGCLVLILGQTLFERILKLDSTLAVIIEFCGGLLFLALLAKGKVK